MYDFEGEGGGAGQEGGEEVGAGDGEGVALGGADEVVGGGGGGGAVWWGGRGGGGGGCEWGGGPAKEGEALFVVFGDDLLYFGEGDVQRF